MNKYFTVILLTVLFCLTLSCANAAGKDNVGYHDQIDQGAIRGYENIKLLAATTIEGIVVSDMQEAPVFRLPSSLLIIEDEAFEGTAIASIELPEKVESIGDNAFANIPTLYSIRISTSTKHIAKTAFTGSQLVTIIGESNGYAKTWARENGIPFIPIPVICADHGYLEISLFQKQIQYDADLTVSAASMEEHPQWRPVSEIIANQYEELLATCILGRAPPACYTL